MKLKEGFILREICGEKLITHQGDYAVDFRHLLTLNETAEWLWRKAGEQGEFSIESLANALCAEYNVDLETAHAHVDELVARWQKFGLVE